MRGGYFNTETQRHRGFIPRERKTLCLRVSVLKIVPSFLLSFLIACGAGVQVSCANEDNPAGQQGTYSGVPLIIFDTDIGSSTDDLFALEMLYRYEQQGACKLLGVVVDREGEDCAAVADVMNNYFGHASTPIGLVRKGIPAPAVWIDYKSLPTYTNDDGGLMFRRSVDDYSALPDGWQLYRRLLSRQPDFNFGQGITFAQDFFRLWPQDVDMVFSPGEVGDPIEYTPEQVVSDISWTDIHPIKQVYMTCDCNTGQKMWDTLPVIQAVEGDGVFSLSARGTVSITWSAETFFTPSPTGNCRYQLPGTAEWVAQILEKIRRANRQR